MDLKYELTRHPAIRHTSDGGAPPYIHHQKRPKRLLPDNRCLSRRQNFLTKKRSVSTMKKIVKKDNLERRAGRLCVRCISVILCFALTILTASAAGGAAAGGDPLTVVNNLSDFIFALIRAVGIILLGFGVLQIGLSLKSHDPSQRANGIMTVAGGIVITFSKEILTLITGSERKRNRDCRKTCRPKDSEGGIV